MHSSEDDSLAPPDTPDAYSAPEEAAPASIIEPKPALSVSVPATPAANAPLWMRVIRSPGLSPILRAILTNSSLTSLEAGTATIVCAPKFAPGAAKWLPQITEIIGREHGSPVQILLRTAGEGETIAPISASSPAPTTDDPAADQQQSSTAPISSPPAPRTNLTSAADHPLVKQALELFGGRIVDVQPRRHT